MLSYHVGLVSETNNITASELNIVAAALQKQVTRDFGPVWGITANVSAFASRSDVPTDYWPVMIKDDIATPHAAGVHEDDHGQPYALVQYSQDWSLTTSHETLEMLGDPFGRRLVAGQSPKAGQGRVNFLVEVCDPSEDAAFAYTVNGVVVSDFLTPHFYDPTTVTGVRYSFTGAIKSPRTIQKGGYLSWVVPTTNDWWQAQWFGGTKPVFKNLGPATGKADTSLRSWIDSQTLTPQGKLMFENKFKPSKESQLALADVLKASAARVARLKA